MLRLVHAVVRGERRPGARLLYPHVWPRAAPRAAQGAAGMGGDVRCAHELTGQLYMGGDFATCCFIPTPNFMERYLSFELSADDAKQSDFIDYTLGTDLLLPHYFGNIAPINIFLGENNSGKSRFMRAIMKCNPTRFFTFDSIHKELLDYINEALESLSRAVDVPIFDIAASIHPAAAGNKLIENLLQFKQDNYTEITKLTIKSQETINELIDTSKELIHAFSSNKLILDLFSSKDLSDKSEQITSCVASLVRAKSIYGSLGNRGFRSIGLELKSISNNTASYAGNHIGIVFHAGSGAAHFNSAHFTNTISENAVDALEKIIESYRPIIKTLISIGQERSRTYHRTYVPALRTARTLIDPSGNRINQDMIKATVDKDYSLNGNDIIVNTGISLYNAIDEKRNSDIVDREQFEAFENFLSETFFNGQVVRVVPNRKDTSILVAVNREERALPYLGDGIQAIILLLYPLFIAPEESLFFIEEPEIHLHPGFQRLFIKTLATHPVLLEKNLTIFLTTHSNHLLDFALDEARNINLFTFRKSLSKSGQAKYQVQLTAPHDLDCLNALGVQNSSVFLSNCTVWVEGITDRIYLKAYLAAYLQHRKQTFSLLEGLHYSFLEYAGANVSHYTFGAKDQQITITGEALKDIQALSISNRIMLIADQDAGKETKHYRLTSQRHAGFEYVVIPTREIENMLTPEVIVGALKKVYPKQAQHFTADQLKQSQYKSIYLAKHLQGKFAELPNSFVGSSGTVSSAKKRLFAEAAAETITSWDMLSPEAQDLTGQVFRFIMGHNPRLGSN
jgi:predicted ATP-dependent endonuclease of OLD family